MKASTKRTRSKDQRKARKITITDRSRHQRKRRLHRARVETLCRDLLAKRDRLADEIMTVGISSAVAAMLEAE